MDESLPGLSEEIRRLIAIPRNATMRRYGTPQPGLSHSNDIAVKACKIRSQSKGGYPG